MIEKVDSLYTELFHLSPDLFAENISKPTNLETFLKSSLDFNNPAAVDLLSHLLEYDPMVFFFLIYKKGKIY